MRIRKHKEATPEQIAAAEGRMSRNLRQRRLPEPDQPLNDPWAALDVPDGLSVWARRERGEYVGTVSWWWESRSYPVEIIGSDGAVVRTTRTQHVPKRGVQRSFRFKPLERPTPGQLMRELGRLVWRMGSDRVPAPVQPYFQPPLPGL